MKKTQIILLNDPKVLAISIVEDAEALFDLTDQTEISWGPSPEIPNNNDYTKVRTSIYHKLVAAQNLLPGGLKLCLYEGYRSLALQEKLFGDRFASLNKKHPDWSRHKVFMATALMVHPSPILMVQKIFRLIQLAVQLTCISSTRTAIP